MRIALIIILLLSNLGLGGAYGMPSAEDAGNVHAVSFEMVADLDSHVPSDSESMCDSTGACGCNMCSAHCSVLVLCVSYISPKTYDSTGFSSPRLFVVSAEYPSPERPPKPL